MHHSLRPALRTMASAATPDKAVIPIVSYNVLSDKLGTPKSYPGLDAADLDPDTRWTRVKAKLGTEIEKDRPVIALQEVSRKWAAKLQVMFERHGYCFMSSHYGAHYSGFMGCGLAYPREQFSLEDSAFTRVSHSKTWPHPRKQAAPSFLAKVLSAIKKCFAALLALVVKAPKAKRCPWDYSKNRNNTMISVLLQSKDVPAVKLSVSTYHMPCAFWDPRIMTIHTALAAQSAHRAAKGSPYVLLGDFNLKPNDPAYNLMVDGALPEDDAGQPEPLPHDPWRPTVPLAYTSAYRAVLGKEPKATNHTLSWSDNKPFTDCLDYIFCSPGVKPIAVLDLPDPDTTPPCPSATEPSDHWLVGTTVEVDASSQ